MKWLMVVSVLYLATLAVGQTNPCDWVSQADHSQGTVCHAPFKTVVQSGVSTITAWEFVPEVPQNTGKCPLVAQANKTFAICGKQINGQNVFTFDFGDGNGYNPMPPGPQGLPGQAATITIGTVTATPSGSPPSVKNIGTTQAAILNFGLPQGNPGTNGVAATITPGQVTTLPAGSPATVTNVGTNQNAILNFGIPQGPPGNIALPATLILTCAKGKGTVQLGYVSLCVLTQPRGRMRNASKHP